MKLYETNPASRPIVPAGRRNREITWAGRASRKNSTLKYFGQPARRRWRGDGAFDVKADVPTQSIQLE
jgi:hypothetical protein